MFKVCMYISHTCLEVVSSSLRGIRKAVLAGHAGVAGGDRDGSRKYRSTGRAPQAHCGHVVCRTANSAPRCYELNRVGRERLPGIYCSHNFRRRPVQTGHKLRYITCTLVIMRLASWCNRSAADIARSRPMCSSQYSGDRSRR